MLEKNKQEHQNFKVNLTGIIELLSEHIYSAPIVFIRELLQNASDAITAQQLAEQAHQGAITITLTSTPHCQLTFTDNGIGLTEEQLHHFLAVIGESSKRNNLYSNSFIGKFGIGLLSCFMVSSKIEVQTRSQLSAVGYKWVADSNGTYYVEELTEEIPFGTSVLLHPKHDSMYYFAADTITSALKKYGEILPYPITFIHDTKATLLNDLNPSWLNPLATRSEWLDYGKKTFNKNFISAFFIDIPVVGLKGTCFIQDIKSHIQQKAQSKLFVKNMLLSEKNENLLPDWAFFIQAVLNITDLSLTASRDAFVTDAFYKTAKEVIAIEIKQHITKLAQSDANTFAKIVQSHAQSIKMLAVEDDTMLELFMDSLLFETNKGTKDLKWIKTQTHQINYTTSNDDFRQIKRIASAQDTIVINACYSFEADILRKIANNYPANNIKPINPFDLIKTIEIPPSEQQNQEYNRFIEKANSYLEPYFCVANLTQFQPTDLPVLFVADEKSANQHKYQNQSKSTNNPFNAVVQNLNNQAQQPILCFNTNNELVRNIIFSEKETTTEHLIKLLYIQSLFLAQYPVQRNEMELMNLSLTQLLKN